MPREPDRPASSSSRIRGRVLADGHPVVDATIMIFPVNIGSNMEGAMTAFLRPVTSDADGRFEIGSLRPGAYTITGSSPGYVSSEQDSKPFYHPGDTVTLNLVKAGVVTGRVTNSSGNPVVGAVVRAIKIREPDDKPARARRGMFSQVSAALSEILGPFKTDDRGIYRIYGLAPGVYQVAAGGRGSQGFSLAGPNAYDGDAPTYYPASTLETAADVIVLAGEEASNIDIRYRENRGYVLSGTISFAGGVPLGTSVLLTRAGSGVLEASTAILSARTQNRFAFDNLLDGDYLVAAMGGAGVPMASPEGMTALVSQPRRVTVKGADVTGIDLTLEPVASIAGRLVVEPLPLAKQKPECKDIRSVPIEGVVLGTRDRRKPANVDPISANLADFKTTTPDEKGEFLIPFVSAGVQRLEVQLAAAHLYVKGVVRKDGNPNAKPVDVARNGITVKSGDKIKGMVITVSEGAAGLQGKVIAENENKPPSVPLRVHLVPAEPEAADEVLRYSEAPVTADGNFSMTNLAPGKYWLVAREISDQESDEDDRRPLAWEPGERTALRFEGEASKKVVELSQCRRVTDSVIRYAPLIKPSKPSSGNPR